MNFDKLFMSEDGLAEEEYNYQQEHPGKDLDSYTYHVSPSKEIAREGKTGKLDQVRGFLEFLWERVSIPGLAVGTILPYAIGLYAKELATTDNAFVKGNLADILVPYGLYNFWSSMGSPTKLNLAATIGSYFAFETAQAFGIWGTFDPWDYAAYATAGALGVATEKITKNIRRQKESKLSIL